MKHSWRVAILPQLGYTDLYSKYNFDEPWDSAGNKKLLNTIPDVYRGPGAEEDSSDASWFAVVGEGTAFESDEGHQFEDFTDGTSITLLVVESRLSIPWSQPKDIEYFENKPLPKLGGFYKDGFMSVFVDGAPHFIADKVKDDVLRNLILRADGNLIDHKESLLHRSGRTDPAGRNRNSMSITLPRDFFAQLPKSADGRHRLVTVETFTFNGERGPGMEPGSELVLPRFDVGEMSDTYRERFVQQER